MDAHVAMTFLETTVFAHEVQVITTDDNGTLHLVFAHDTGQDAATDSYISGPWALLVNVSTINGLAGEKKIRLMIN